MNVWVAMINLVHILHMGNTAVEIKLNRDLFILHVWYCLADCQIKIEAHYSEIYNLQLGKSLNFTSIMILAELENY